MSDDEAVAVEFSYEEMVAALEMSAPLARALSACVKAQIEVWSNGGPELSKYQSLALGMALDCFMSTLSPMLRTNVQASFELRKRVHMHRDADDFIASMLTQG